MKQLKLWIKVSGRKNELRERLSMAVEAEREQNEWQQEFLCFCVTDSSV